MNRMNWASALPRSSALPLQQMLTSLQTVAVAPVPEPETWALMIGGIAVLAHAARRRKGVQRASLNDRAWG